MSARWRAFALAVAALAIIGGTLKQLTTKQLRQTGSNEVSPQQFAVEVPARAGVCQAGETLYEGTRSLQLTVARFGRPGKRLDVVVRRDGRTLASGRLDPGWKEGVVSVPLSPVPRASTSGVRICVRSNAPGRFAFGSEPTAPSELVTSGGKPQGGRISLRSFAGEQSLLGYAGSIASHYSRGTSDWLGGWTLWLIIALLLGGMGVAGLALVRPRGRHVALAIILAGTGWALLTPPFMVPDETAHFAYVQALVETGDLPKDGPAGEGSDRERATLGGLRFYDVIGDAAAKPPWTAEEERALRKAERAPASRRTSDAGTASNNPPLYYLAEAPVYALFRGASTLTALIAMRLLSVLLCGLAAWFVFRFLRELLPTHPLAASAGALVAGFQPVFGFIGAGVNADAALFAVSAASAWIIALVFRRGLTTRRALTLGAVVAVGMLIKPLFLGLVPALLAALGLAALRERASWRDRARLLGIGLTAAVVPVLLYDLIGSAVFDHGLLPGAAAGASASQQTPGNGLPTGYRAEVVYIWQLFLPRLPFMQDLLPGLPLRDIWFDGLVGRFGWLDYSFPRAATDQALWVVWVVLALAVVGLVRARATLLRNWPLLLCLVLMAVGVMAAIGTQQWRAAITGAAQFIQPRYLLPLLGLYGAIVAAGVTSLGRRPAFVLATAVSGLAIYHTVAAMILTVSRFYA